MKQSIRFILILSVLTVMAGCGGGSDDNGVLPPGTHNLAGLEGVWTVDLSFTGTLNSSTGSTPVSDSGTGTWTFSTNAISSGFPLEWSYDGSTLSVHWESTVGNVDPVCGTELTTVSATLSLPITPGSTSSTITGSGEINKTTTGCGNSSGTIVYSGTITKT